MMARQARREGARRERASASSAAACSASASPTSSPRRGVQVDGLRGRRRSSAASPAAPSSAACASTASTTRSPPTDQRVLDLADELGLDDPLAPARRRLLPRRPPRRDVDAARAAHASPACRPADRARLVALRRCAASAIDDHAQLDELGLEDVDPPHLRRPPVGAPVAAAVRLQVRRPLRRPARHLPVVAHEPRRPARATARAARSWARSRAATRRSSTGSRDAHPRARRRGPDLDARCGSSRARTTARIGVVLDAGFRPHDTVVATQIRPNLPHMLAPELEQRARARPPALPRHRLPRRARAQQRQPVLRAEHHRPAGAAHERGRDDARRRPGGRRGPPRLPAEVRQPGLARAREVLGRHPRASTSAT